ncbi:MAG: CPBP family intramembrane metalloprotease [Acidobacteria bacterium]|nr:CPBP family intramembrane metalloprotease [Acidobacteriota bacterium]
MFALIGVACILIWSPPLDPLVRPGSALRRFLGLGLSTPGIIGSLVYGAFQTGFTEELLFRGLIAGSLSRRLPLAWANFVQALIFLLPHLLILQFAPEMFWLLPVVFGGALVYGWVSIKSGSIIGPGLMHSSGNVAMALTVANGRLRLRPPCATTVVKTKNFMPS